MDIYSSTSSIVTACLVRRPGAAAGVAVAVAVAGEAADDSPAAAGAGAVAAASAAVAAGVGPAPGTRAAATAFSPLSARSVRSLRRFSPTLRSFFFLGSSHAQRGMNEST